MMTERVLQVFSSLIAFLVILTGGAFFFWQGGAFEGGHRQPFIDEEHATTSERNVPDSVMSTSTAPLDIATTSPNLAPGGTVVPHTVIAPTHQPERIIKTPGALRLLQSNPPVISPETVATVSPKAELGSDSSQPLNQNDIVGFTNSERAANGLPPLNVNKQLSAIAKAKALDMIDKQYFAHVSPTGVDIAKMSETYGYAYLYIGENLALGDFVSSREVVTGWMNSPGHRANILNKNYKEIGASAVLGTYEGHTVWFAVQEFGRPLSDCLLPDVLLEKKIAIYQNELAQLEKSLASLSVELESPGISIATHNSLANDYNLIVDLHNTLVDTTKKAVATYNTGAEAYNACIGTE